MSDRAPTSVVLLATIVAGGLIVAVTGSGSTANASGVQRSNAAVGEGHAGPSHALDMALLMTRSADRETYRAAGMYSAGSALTSSDRPLI